MKTHEVALLTLFLNGFAFALKIFVGIFSSSLAIVSESFHSLFDSLSSLTAYFSLKFSSQKPDKKHLYGHKRIEPLASIASSILLLAFIAFVLRESFDKLLKPEIINLKPLFLLALFLVLPLNYLTYKIEYCIGKKEASLPLIADSYHTKADILLTIAVILSSISIYYFSFPPIIDPLMSFLVIIFLLKNILEVIYDSIDTIIGKSPGKEFFRKVNEVCLRFEEIKDIHKVRAEKIGNHVSLDLHLIFKKDIPLSKACKICEKVKKEVKNELKEVKDIIVFAHPHKFKCK
ncbi:MAG: cation diffusion facilitator family transporter [Candidatus Aenigmatarchaeota archaeon]